MAKVLSALMRFFGVCEMREEVAKIEQHVAGSLLIMTPDGSNMVGEGVSNISQQGYQEE